MSIFICPGCWSIKEILDIFFREPERFGHVIQCQCGARYVWDGKNFIAEVAEERAAKTEK